MSRVIRGSRSRNLQVATVEPPLTTTSPFGYHQCIVVNYCTSSQEDRRKSLGTRDKIHRGQNHAKRLTTSDGCLLLLCVVRLGKDCGISYCNYLRILLKTVGFFFTENVPSRRSIMTNGTDSNTSFSFQIFFSKLSKSLENSTMYF